MIKCRSKNIFLNFTLFFNSKSLKLNSSSFPQNFNLLNVDFKKIYIFFKIKHQIIDFQKIEFDFFKNEVFISTTTILRIFNGLPKKKNKLERLYIRIRKKNKRNLKLKHPKFNKKSLNFTKLHKFILKNLFCMYNYFELGSFFKSVNSVYGFLSLNFFFLFINSLFVSEHLIDYEEFDWDGHSIIDFDGIKNRISTLNINCNNYIMYNNHLPVLVNDFYIKNKFLKAVKDVSNVNLNKFQQLYYISLFEYFLKKRIFFRSESNFFKKYKPTSEVENLINSYGKYNFKISQNLHISELVQIIWYSFQFKDLRLLNNWLQKIMPMLKIKHHKVLLNHLRQIVERNSGLFTHLLNINGFFFKIKGKISVTGNAKKRNTVIRFGSIDLSTKSKKIEYEEGIINTRVGILGYKMFLSF